MHLDRTGTLTWILLVAASLLGPAGAARAAGQLTYSPAEPMLVIGNQGGTFAPLSKVYTLSNTGNEALGWIASSFDPGVQFSPPNGALAPGQSSMITVSLDPVQLAQLGASFQEFEFQIDNVSTGVSIREYIEITTHAANGAPPNDDLTHARRDFVQTRPMSVAVRLDQATREPGEPQHGGHGGTTSVWFAIYAPNAGYLTFDTIGSQVDTVLAAYTPFTKFSYSYDRIRPLASNDNIGPGETASRLRLYLGPADMILFAVDAKTPGATGVVQANWRWEFAAPSPVVSAILPISRATAPNSTVTAFATMINSGAAPLTGCFIGMPATLYGDFAYQATNAQNLPIGTPNTPVNLPPGSAQSFIMSFTPAWSASTPSELRVVEYWPEFACTNAAAGVQFRNLNTFELSSVAWPTADIIPIISTASNDGYLTLASPSASAAFSAAGINLGAATRVDVEATLSWPVNLTMSLCETNASTGQCLAPPTLDTITVPSWAHNEVRTFAVFATAQGAIPDDAFRNRVLLSFRAAQSSPFLASWPSGRTSVAVRTQAP